MLSQPGSMFGTAVLNVLLPALENQIGTLVVVLAGYKKDMDELFEKNQGLPSRVDQRFIFADYREEELLTMLQKELAAQKHLVDSDHLLHICAKRLVRQSGRVGFGNMRTVKSTVARWMQRQSQRLTQLPPTAARVDKYLLVEEDVLGPNPCTISEENCAELRQLNSMIGLESIKAQVRGLIAMVRANFELERQLKEPRQVALNRIFLGNPGTGTTATRQTGRRVGLWARIAGMGCLSDAPVSLPF